MESERGKRVASEKGELYYKILNITILDKYLKTSLDCVFTWL